MARLGTSDAVGAPVIRRILKVYPSEHHAGRAVAELGKHLAGALAYIHPRGILHRVLKPSNILVGLSDGSSPISGLASCIEGPQMSSQHIAGRAHDSAGGVGITVRTICGGS